MQFQMTLTAGVPVRQQTAGGYFLLDSLGTATSLDVVMRYGAEVLEHVTTATRGMKARMPPGQRFDAIDFTSSVNTTISFFISDGLVDVSMDGMSVQATIVGPLPVPTSNDRGAPGNPVYVNTALAGLPVALAVVDDAAVAVTAAVTVALPALVNRIRAIFTNLDPVNAVAIGSPTLTWAKRAIVLQPGDTWVEERGANLAWSAICGPTLTASLGVQEVTA